MAINFTRNGDPKGLTSWISLGDLEDEGIAREIYRQRGRVYDPKTFIGRESYIADTDIRLVGSDLESSAERFDDLHEYHPIWDDFEVEDHVLPKTAKVYIRNNGDIVASGWLVPYSPEFGIPMENRHGEQGYRWDGYLDGNDKYLQKHGIETIDSLKAIEIGRFSNIDGPYAFKLLIRTLYRFLKELGVEDYFDAAMDEPGRNYASLYEMIGNRKVEQYTADTVTEAKKDNGIIIPVKRSITYWSQHNNVRHTEERAKNNDFGNPEGAKISRKMIQYISPELMN